MPPRSERHAALLAVVLIIVAACSAASQARLGPAATTASTARPQPSSRHPRPRRKRGRSDGASALPTKLPDSGVGGKARRRRSSAGTAASGRATRPNRSRWSSRSPRRSTRPIPASTCSSRANPTQLARDSLSVQLAFRTGPDIVGPVGIGGAEPSTASGSTSSRYIDKNRFDMTQFPASTVHLYNVGGDGQVGIPFAIYPSVMFYKRQPVQGSRPDRAAAPVEQQLHDARRVGRAHWNYDTVRKLAFDPDRGQERQGRHRSGFDRRTSSQWGFEPQRDDLRRPAPIGRPAASLSPTARPSRSPTPGRPPGTPSTMASGRITSASTGPQFLTGLQPEWLPVLHRQGRDERELPVVHLRRQRRRG